MKTRMDELRAAEIDYSIPIDIFSRKASTLFNQLARKLEVPSRVSGAEYGDGSARLYLNGDSADLVKQANLFLEFSKEVCVLAAGYSKLTKIELPVTGVTQVGGEINVNFDGPAPYSVGDTMLSTMDESVPTS